DPVPRTGRWLQSNVQGHFNYYAVPVNLKSLGRFRDRVLALWWRALRRRSQNTQSRGRASSHWLSVGFLNRARFIPFRMHASPPLICDKNRLKLLQEDIERNAGLSSIGRGAFHILLWDDSLPVPSKRRITSSIFLRRVEK